MRIYRASSMDWETDVFFPSKAAAVKWAKQEAKETDSIITIVSIDFETSKANLLQMLNGRPYATDIRTVYESDSTDGSQRSTSNVD